MWLLTSLCKTRSHRKTHTKVLRKNDMKIIAKSLICSSSNLKNCSHKTKDFESVFMFIIHAVTGMFIHGTILK